MSSSADDSNEWSISVKTVGAELQDSEGEVIPSSFQVRVKPNEDIQSLYDRIEAVTGLKRNQQRLIYRGRIIQPNSTAQTEEMTASSSLQSVPSPAKISEIKGLGDGQTIHLVRRQESAASEEQEDGDIVDSLDEVAALNRGDTSESSEGASGAGSSGGSGAATSSLLAALLGLSALEEDGDGDGPTTRSSRGGGWRRFGGNRRSNFRLTAQDLEVSDPGSMESVRQGLMTLHTLLPIAEQRNPVSPLEHSRRWYLGQWVDCRDTVNQWLEATIVGIVRPDEILPPQALASSPEHRRSSPVVLPAMDPAVGSSDFDGRRRLLLEPCEDGDPEDIGGDFAGYRRRDTNNEDTLLLLIHYSGWPHRWDEWIRSDSERLRPFRVRTRHNTSSNYVSPTTQNHYADSPQTFFGGRTEVEDRSFLLDELVHVTSAVNQLAQDASRALPPTAAHVVDPDTGDIIVEPMASDLPWGAGRSNAAERSAQSFASPAQSLEMLAPLLDRLGRILVDAAPHVAALAAANSNEAADTVIPDADERGNEENDADDTEASNNNSPSSLGGLLSLLNRERRRNSRTSQSQSIDQAQTHDGSDAGGLVANRAPPQPVVDPDYTDFATGLVNVSRGDVRSGPRSGSIGRNGSGRDELSGLLGAYLAAASLGGLTGLSGSDGDEGNGNNELQGLGRLLRNPGGNGENGGIDIHIHAVVTAPGVTPTGGAGTGGGVSMGVLGGGGAGTGAGSPSPDLFANTRRASAQRVRATLLEQNDSEDNGIFDDLYSETPDPVSPSASSEASESVPTQEGDNNNNTETGRPTTAPFAPEAVAPRRVQNPQLPARGRSRRNNNNGSSNRTSFLGRLFRRSGTTE